ncbi:centriolar coiled-coil protein of 110 kDa-like isoform X2 [Ambystoma mexicanum]|uniref:centriolar coiled-coil protein of 110 kDa-like isoform X2 n=1 Tax=Ambystoma mexicanum TaxID=8296 RepID=UPI0037E9BCA9
MKKGILIFVPVVFLHEWVYCNIGEWSLKCRNGFCKRHRTVLPLCQIEMEEYEEFCKKHLARIQAEAIDEGFFISTHQSVSLIQFHGVAVLSPLLDSKKKKEMQQYRQKAIELEASKQSKKNTSLLNRVHEILDNVQVRKVPSLSDVGVEEAELTLQCSDSRSTNGFAILPNIISMPALTAESGHAKVERPLKDLSLDPDTVLKSAETMLATSTEESSSPKLSASPDTTQSENGGPIPTDSIITRSMPQFGAISNANEESDAPQTLKESPDPYVMSLQNLLKRSREYIERDQTRLSMRRGSNGSVNECHSDKENEVIKISDSLKEKVKLTNGSRSSSPVTLDKPSLNESNMPLQCTHTQVHSLSSAALSSFSKADIPARSRSPSTVDTESDEELKSNFAVDYESSIFRSLTGSYAKLPSPELCLSPKMHRRRLRTASMGHIVINHPINACGLSPMNRSQIMANASPDLLKNVNICETLSNCAVDNSGVYINNGKVLSKCTSESFDASYKVTSNIVCKEEIGVMENKDDGVAASKEMATLVTESHLTDQTSTECSRLYDPGTTFQSPELFDLSGVNGFKPNSLSDKAKRTSPAELNKSYDVETPSPMLLHSRSSQQKTSSNLSEEFLDSSFETQVKRRLDLDMGSAHKENNPFASMMGTSEPEKQWLHTQKCLVRTGSGSSHKSEALNNDSLDEDILKRKLLAFEEMRKRLEEQHAQQLSLLIAEQEREQESLQKEIEEQERRLKSRNSDARASSKISAMRMSNGFEMDWKKRNESSVLDMRWTPLESGNSPLDQSSGLISTTSHHSLGSTGDTLFYFLKSANVDSAHRPLGRTRTRWSQVFSQDMQTKLNKVTALAKGFLTRRIMQTDKLKQLKKTVNDTAEFMKMFQFEVPLKRGTVSAQDASLQERVLAQLRATLYEIHDIFFVMDASERMRILQHDREVRREKLIRQMEKTKSPHGVSLSAATQKSLDRKKLLKAVEMGMPKKVLRQKTSETSRILQPSHGQNASVNRLFSREGTFKNSLKHVEQYSEKSSSSRLPNKIITGVFTGRTQKKRPNAVTI